MRSICSRSPSRSLLNYSCWAALLLSAEAGLPAGNVLLGFQPIFYNLCLLKAARPALFSCSVQQNTINPGKWLNVWEGEKKGTMREKMREGQRNWESNCSPSLLSSWFIILLIIGSPNAREGTILWSFASFQSAPSSVGIVLKTKCMMLIIWRLMVTGETETTGQTPSTQCGVCEFSLLDV